MTMVGDSATMPNAIDNLWTLAKRKYPPCCDLISEIHSAGGEAFIGRRPRYLRRVRQRALDGVLLLPPPAEAFEHDVDASTAEIQKPQLQDAAARRRVRLPLEEDFIWSAVCDLARTQGFDLRHMERRWMLVEAEKARFRAGEIVDRLNEWLARELRGSGYRVTGCRAAGARTDIGGEDLINLRPDLLQNRLWSPAITFENVTVSAKAEVAAPAAPVERAPARAPAKAATERNVDAAARTLLATGIVARKHGSKGKLLDLLVDEFGPDTSRSTLSKYANDAHVDWRKAWNM